MRPFRALLIACLAAVVAACGGGGGGGGDNELAFRVIHASPDAPLFNVLLDNRLIASSVDYRQGTGFLLLTPRTYDIAVDAIVPSGTDRVVELTDQALEKDVEYTVIALGLKATDDVEGLLIQNPIESIAGGDIRLQFVHGAPEASAVDIYVTAVDAVLADSVPFASGVTFRDFTPRQTLPAGEYQVRITPAGDTGTVLFDSGPVSFASNADLLGLAVPNTGTITLTAGLPFPESTGYQVIPAKEYEFAAVDPAVPATALWERSLTVFKNQRLTVANVGLFEDVTGVVLFDDVRPVATEAKLRIINGAPAASLFDVYITAPGQDINSAAPVLRSLALGTASSYLSVAPQDYQVTMTTVNTKTVLATATTDSEAGSAFTVIVRDKAGGGTPLGVIIENDLP